MAPRGSKRGAAQSAEEPEAKRVADFLKEHGVTKASYQPVPEAVEHPFARLTEDERRVVLAVLPWSLPVPADMRSEAQAAAVSMVDNVLGAVRAALQEAADVEAEQVDVLEESRVALEAAVQYAAAAELEARQAEGESRGMLAEADAVVEQKRTPLQVAELEGKRLGDELEHARAQKAQLEEAYFHSFAQLREGNFEDSKVESLVESVMAVAKACLEEPLLLALPGALANRERGSFDVAVVHQAEEVLRGKVVALGELAQAAEAVFAAQAAIAQAAQAAFDTAMAAQLQAADGFRGAQGAGIGAATAAKSARMALSELEAKLAIATAARSEKSADLDQFCAYHVFMFELLRDRQSSKGCDTQAEARQAPAGARQAAQAAGEEAPAEVLSKLAAEYAPSRSAESRLATEVPGDDAPADTPSEAIESQRGADLASEEAPTQSLSEVGRAGEEVPRDAPTELAQLHPVAELAGEHVPTDLPSKVSVESCVGDLSISLAGA